MTNVQMLVHITGGRADGTDWPYVGHDKPLKVSPAEAEDLYRAQLARPWPGGDDEEPDPVETATPEPVLPETAAAEPAQWPPAEPGRMGTQMPPPVPGPEPLPEPEPAPVPAPEAGPVQAGPPRPAAPKSEWAAWASSQGAQPEWVESATKQQLMEHYGVRP